MKKECTICGNQMRFLHYITKDGFIICPKCFNKCELTVGFNSSDFTYQYIKDLLESKGNKTELTSVFNPTKKVFFNLYVDEINELWAIPDPLFGSTKKSIQHSFNEIVDFELLEDGESITKGGLGRATIGAIGFGLAGAVIGGASAKRKSKNICNSLRIKITLNSIQRPVAYIEFIQFSTKHESLTYKNAYKNAQECLSVLELICKKMESKEKTNNFSVADELIKLKSLLDLDTHSRRV